MTLMGRHRDFGVFKLYLQKELEKLRKKSAKLLQKRPSEALPFFC